MDKVQFRGELAFLSNLFETEIAVAGMKFRNVEAAFQSFKDEKRQQEFEKLDGVTAKKLGRKVNLRKDWEQKKDSLMYELLKIKFTNAELKQKLIETGDVVLVEINYWGDKYWGVFKGQGKNQLGNLLMKIREDLKKLGFNLVMQEGV